LAESVVTPKDGTTYTDKGTIMNSTCKLASAGIMTVGLTAFGLLGATAANASGVQPVGADDYYTINQGETLTVAAPGVLANDVDPEGDPIYVGNSFAYNGADTVTVNGDGSFTFTPTAGFYGEASFQYYSSDATNLGSAVTVHITVKPLVAPVPLHAEDDSYSTPKDTVLAVPAGSGLLVNDSGPGFLWVANGSPVANNEVIANSDGSFTYTPPVGFEGTAVFYYRTSDGITQSNDAAVTITVGTPPVMVPPAPLVVGDDFYSMDQDTVLTVPAGMGILANDSGAVTVANVNGGGGNLQVQQSDGSFVYTPPAGFVGTMTWQYRTTDGTQYSSFATLTIVVNPVAVPPVVGGGAPGGGLVPQIPVVPQTPGDLPTLAYTGGTDDVSTWLAAPAAALIGLGGLGLWYSRRRAQNS